MPLDERKDAAEALRGFAQAIEKLETFMHATVLAGGDDLIGLGPLPMSMFVEAPKYRPDSPARFGCIEDARACCAGLITSYIYIPMNVSTSRQRFTSTSWREKEPAWTWPVGVPSAFAWWTPEAEKRGVHSLHPGHDGSAGVITNELGAVVERRSYDPFGQRRNADWATGGPAAAPPSETIGFTGHEDEDELSLINMRGRIYDPALGRFLSADPFVQAPFFSQSLNRYSYAFNNPLSFVDPTGYQATDEYEYHHPGLTYDGCVPGAGCVGIQVGQVDLPGIYNDLASGEPFGHREPGPPGLGLDFSLDVSDLRPGDALGSRWNPHSPLGQAGRDVFGEEMPIATWSLSPEMTRAVMGLIPVPGMSSLLVFTDPHATPTDKAIAVALDALSVVGVGVVIKLAGKAGMAGSAARAGVEAWGSRSGLQGVEGVLPPPQSRLPHGRWLSRSQAGTHSRNTFFGEVSSHWSQHPAGSKKASNE
ncbi:RHS repeat domain-containing protein [Sorangium cellulosum]|uniref:Teneurin-like YD-shell domain-containing protein n=1 Tax=Sorangium cellulosum So0157-2 TaxID=1254432 RepID=S4YAC3_SORCE|nr:RHS repeat-associated core domain-containing protein [Sorangium cellulosum]AGP41250.1 hypothetical protein SCE1572_46230 [Sorangium cellulosum So0157-2]